MESQNVSLCRSSALLRLAWSGRRDLHPRERVGSPTCCCYITAATWSGRRESHPRPLAWQASVLLLNYARVVGVEGLAPPSAWPQTMPSAADLHPVARVHRRAALGHQGTVLAWDVLQREPDLVTSRRRTRQRRGRESNPRTRYGLRFSKPAPGTNAGRPLQFGKDEAEEETCSALPLSYGHGKRPTGLEPATSRLEVEVPPTCALPSGSGESRTPKGCFTSTGFEPVAIAHWLALPETTKMRRRSVGS